MKRPLLVVAMFLVAVSWMILATGGYERPPVLPEEEHPFLQITGQVCQKEQDKIWLDSVEVLFIDNSIHSNNSNVSNSNSMAYSKKMHYTPKIICEFPEGTLGELPREGNSTYLYMGQTISVTGEYYAFSSATNAGEFDTRAYYRSLGTEGKLKNCELVNNNNKQWRILEAAYRVRVVLARRINRIMQPETAAVMSALLLGDKSELDSEQKDLYKRSGILHILSISSLHITIIGMTLYKLLRKMGATIIPAALAGAFLLLFYGAVVGFSISACRAIGMYLLRMFAEICGRTYDMLTALGALALVMVLQNPYRLQNAGFLLSFTSVFGIGTVYPRLLGRRKIVKAKYFGEPKYKIWIRKLLMTMKEAWVASTSIMLATLPVQLWFYYEVPVYSVELNLLILPLVKPLLAAGFISMLPGFGKVSVLDSVILQWYEKACLIFDRLPLRTWNPGRPALWQVVVYYILLTVIMFLFFGKKPVLSGKIERKRGWKTAERKDRAIKIICLCGVGLLIVDVMLLSAHRFSQNRVLVLDVGQGDCIIIETASGEHFLYDCGSSSRSMVGKYVLLPCLKYYGIRKLDGIFVSHADMDHMNGVTELLAFAQENRIEIGELALPAIEESERNTEFGALVKGAAESGTEVTYFSAGEKYAEFICLHPSNEYSTENSNAYSLCLLADFGSFTMLFTGDAEEDGEVNMVRELKRLGIHEVTILKCAHHGSRNSTSEDFLQQIQPKAAVISCGRNNRYGHPHKETLERLEKAGSRTFQTKDGGMLTITEKRGKIGIHRYMKDK